MAEACRNGKSGDSVVNLYNVWLHFDSLLPFPARCHKILLFFTMFIHMFRQAWEASGKVTPATVRLGRGFQWGASGAFVWYVDCFIIITSLPFLFTVIEYPITYI